MHTTARHLAAITSSLAAIAALSAPAAAFVSGATGGKKGTTQVEASVTLERGLVEPNENTDSFQDARWNLFNLSATYNAGSVGRFLDLFFRVRVTLFDSPAEVNEEGPVPEADCLGTVLDAETCEFYGDDQGAVLRAAVGFNVIHEPRYTLGFTIEANAPVGVNLDKFANPRVDYIAGSINLGLQLTDWLTYETSIYVGSGPFGPQNAQIAYTQLFGFAGGDDKLRYGIRLGPYIDADLNERFDERYDAAYTTGFPEVQDRIRRARFGGLFNPYLTVSDRYTVKLTYLQKAFGYDAAATQFWDLAVAVAF